MTLKPAARARKGDDTPANQLALVFPVDVMWRLNQSTSTSSFLAVRMTEPANKGLPNVQQGTTCTFPSVYGTASGCRSARTYSFSSRGLFRSAFTRCQPYSLSGPVLGGNAETSAMRRPATSDIPLTAA